MLTVNIGTVATYKGQAVTVVRGAFPRWGDKRVVIQRQSDKRRFTVAVKYLSEPKTQATATASAQQP